MKKIIMLLAAVSFVAVQGFSQNATSSASQKDSKVASTVKPTATAKSADAGKTAVTGCCGRFIDNNGDGKCDNNCGHCQGKGTQKCGDGKHQSCAGKAKSCESTCKLKCTRDAAKPAPGK